MANQALLKLMQEEMKMGLKGGLYHQVQIKLAYNSNRMEGSRLFEDQTRYIFETNTLHVDPEETANVDDIIENTSDERKEWLKTTPPGKVAVKMAELLAAYHHRPHITLEDIVDFHHEFERIHPFRDGNGRVGRIIMFKECLKHDIMPFIVDHEHKPFYYRGLKEYPSEKGYLLDTCRSAQDRFEALVDYFFPELGPNQSL